MSALVSVRFTTIHMTSYIAYLCLIITGPHRSHVCFRVRHLPSYVFRSRSTYHDWNHNDEWPQFSRYKPRDGIDAFTTWIKSVERNAKARIFNAISQETLTVSDKNMRCLVLSQALRRQIICKIIFKIICIYSVVKLYSIIIERIIQKHIFREHRIFYTYFFILLMKKFIYTCIIFKYKFKKWHF